MNKKLIATAALVTVVPVTAGAAFLATTGAANAATPAPQAAITAHASTSTPTSGKVFTVSGDFTENGAPAAGHIVKIQALQANGHYKLLTGARMKTASNGDYTMRVELGTKGVRDLRVVGVGQNTQPNAHQDFSVKVR
jgi:hypothetical protein